MRAMPSNLLHGAIPQESDVHGTQQFEERSAELRPKQTPTQSADFVL